jgi:hypothetical protein
VKTESHAANLCMLAEYGITPDHVSITVLLHMHLLCCHSDVALWAWCMLLQTDLILFLNTSFFSLVMAAS